MEKISVVIPTYNRGYILKKSIESVLQQTFQEIEVLIVDDGSADNTQEIVKSIPDGRIKYIRLISNRGASNARNEGVRQAEGSLIAFHDSDDTWRPDKLEKQMAYWQQHPEYSLIYSACLVHREEGEYRMPGTDWEDLSGRIFRRLLLHNTIDTPTMLMRKDCFLEVGGFDTSLRALEDWDFALRFSERYAIGYVDEILVDSCYSPEGISSGGSAYYESRCRMIGKYREQMINEGVFDAVTGDLFRRAEQRGILEEVKKMVLLFMGG